MDNLAIISEWFFALDSARWISFLATEVLFSSILAAIIWLIIQAFRIKSPYWKGLLWSLFLIRLVLPTGLNSDFSIGALAAATATKLMPLNWSASPETAQPYGIGEASVDDISSFPHGVAAGETGSAADMATVRISYWQIAFAVWLSGFLVLGGLMLRRRRRFRRIVKQAKICSDVTVLSALAEWQNIFGVGRKIRVVHSDAFLSPFAFGIFRPQIYLPTTLITMGDPEVLRGIIAHEVAHIRRYDQLRMQVHQCLQLLYFFHPLMGFVMRRLHQSREAICDHMVISSKAISPAAYGHSMLTVLQTNYWGSAIFAYPAFSMNRRQFIARIQNIKKGEQMKKPHFLKTILMLALLAMFLLPMAAPSTDQAYAADDPRVDTPAAAASDSQINFISPLKSGKLSALIGYRPHPKRKKLQFHKGIDIAAPQGTEIFAIQDGTVSVAGHKGPYGLMVAIKHDNGLISRYAHLDKISVAQRARVKQGDVIGTVGASGLAQNFHLHFEIRSGNRRLNPQEYIDFKGFETVIGMLKTPFVDGSEASSIRLKDPIQEGKITSRYGYQLHPFTGEREFHRGIDIAAPRNTAVYAVAEGVVESAGFDEKRGNYIVVRHGDHYRSLYMHLEYSSVKTGQQVSDGLIIGGVGSSGLATGTHLHFELTWKGKPLNPEQYVMFFGC